MKLYKKISYVALFGVALLSNSCKKVLEENPRSLIPPSFLNSTDGILAGISGVYNDIRNQWGTEGFSIQTNAGTDEVLTGASASGTQFFNYNGLTSQSMNGGIWNTAYQDINTLNGVLQYAAGLTFPASLPANTKAVYIAQAKFLRAYWYFYLVQTFGSVPLHTTFITQATASDSKAPIADVYDQIVKDLTEAAVDLPNTPNGAFQGKPATKGVALYYLGKAYLTRGWSAAAKATDFTDAYTTLTGIITNKATYGYDLWADYGDAFKPANDYGKETIFVSDHSSDPKYGRYILGSSGDGGNNLTPWFNRFNYPTLGVNATVTGSTLTNPSSNNPAMMTRDITNGRPYIRIRPNSDNQATGVNAGKNYVLGQAFADRVNDSRYDKTFQTVWIANTLGITGSRGTLSVGVDTAIYMPPFDVVDAPQNLNGRPFKGIVVPPRLTSNNWYPAVKKFDDVARAGVNDPSTRPVVIVRFSDVYLLAAEAAFKGGGTLQQAADLINVVRRRAAFIATNTPAQNAAAALAQEITSVQVTLDFILDERTREFYGEWQRWWDLVRTQSLLTRVAAWNSEAKNNIKPFHVLRPIPQDQIDRTTEGACLGAACWQNPGY
ncbi:MAG: RagB/SusD family nutrient uptake outer membrane protein [Chitinophagaceae bacterium]